VVSHFAVAKRLGCTDEEIKEAVQVAYSVGAGAMWAMATRAEKASLDQFRWWDKNSVERSLGLTQAEEPPATGSG
jgi:hypothetical protein